MIVIRKAQLEDCPAIAQLHVASWKHTYVGQVPADYLAQLSVSTREHGWRKSFGQPGHMILLAESDSLLQGFVSLGPSRDSDADLKTTGEIYAIYLHPDRKRQGIGTQLWSAAVDALLTQAFSEFTVWVLDTNTPARRFYERRGCSLDGGEKADTIGGKKIAELRYRWRVAQQAS